MTRRPEASKPANAPTSWCSIAIFLPSTPRPSRTPRCWRPISTAVWSTQLRPAAKPKAMARRRAIGGTSARRACASGSTETRAEQTTLVGAHHHAFERHALQLGAGVFRAVLREAGKARAVPLRVVLLEDNSDWLVAVEHRACAALNLAEPALSLGLRGKGPDLHVVGA